MTSTLRDEGGMRNRVSSRWRLDLRNLETTLLTCIWQLLLFFTPCRDEVSGMFHHAYEGYLRHAYPYDELRPISCTGVDTWGSYSLT